MKFIKHDIRDRGFKALEDFLDENFPSPSSASQTGITPGGLLCGTSSRGPSQRGGQSFWFPELVEALAPLPRGEELSRAHAPVGEGDAAGAPPCKINSFGGSNSPQAWCTGRPEEERKERCIISCLCFTANQHLLQKPINQASGTSRAEKLQKYAEALMEMKL